MQTLTTIGNRDPSIHYIDRPTVKVVIKNDDKILVLNNGLLPGGGVERGESNYEAITRELQEELGVTVANVKEIGTVVVDETGSETIAMQVIESSRELYAKKIEEEVVIDAVEPQPKPLKKPSTARKQKKSHATKKASDDLSELKPVA